jgi:FKBP-type peptidyl-prolyl cis-trans isomerase
MRSSVARLARLVAVVAAPCFVAFARGQDDKPPAPAAPAPTPPAGPRKLDAPPPERQCKVDVIAKGDGRQVKAGDVVLAHFVFTVADTGKTLADTRAEGDPQPLEVGGGYTIPALDQAVLKMRVGDHWKIAAPYQLAWGEQGYPPIVPAKADVVLDVEIVGFLEIKTEVLKEGSGPTPRSGDYVLFHDVGTLVNGTVFDDSRAADAPVLVTMGSGQMIQGWELTLRRMKVGDRVKATIPWRYAYGRAGRPPVVPPKADVVFDIERLPLPPIKTEVVTTGAGAPCASGQTVTVHYVGTLTDGKQFDGSRDGGKPYSFVLGAHQVIAGWDLAILTMRVGDRRKITIPWQLAYGAQGKPPVIPPKSDLVFDIEVLEAK